MQVHDLCRESDDVLECAGFRCSTEDFVDLGKRDNDADTCHHSVYDGWCNNQRSTCNLEGSKEELKCTGGGGDSTCDRPSKLLHL